MTEPKGLMGILKSVTSFISTGDLETPKLVAGVRSEGGLVGVVPLNSQSLC